MSTQVILFIGGVQSKLRVVRLVSFVALPLTQNPCLYCFTFSKEHIHVNLEICGHDFILFQSDFNLLIHRVPFFERGECVGAQGNRKNVCNLSSCRKNMTSKQ